MVEVQTVIIILIATLFALFIGFCCRFVLSKRREDEVASWRARRNIQTTQQTRTTEDAQRNTSSVYVVHFRGENSNELNANPVGRNPPAEGRSQENAYDAIVESGPPPYSGLGTDSVEPPPPSYEEAMRRLSE